MSSANTTDIHGHDVLHMMLESDKAYDAAGLEAAIVQKYGAEARFCTCSAAGMTAGQLVTFLSERGKFVPATDGFSTSADKICDH